MLSKPFETLKKKTLLKQQRYFEGFSGQ